MGHASTLPAQVYIGGYKEEKSVLRSLHLVSHSHFLHKAEISPHIEQFSDNLTDGGILPWTAREAKHTLVLASN